MPTLTDAQCRRAQPGPKLTKHFDGGGLHLVVLPTGSKVWRQAYRWQGRQQTKSFGPYPDVSLAQARALRAELQAQLRAGDDPMAERRATRPQRTVREAIAEFWAGRTDITEDYRGNAMRAMDRHVLPHIGDEPIATVTRAQVLDVLLKMEAAGLLDYLRKVRMWLALVWAREVELERAPVNIVATINPARAFKSAPVEHFPALLPREVPEFMARMSLEPELQSVLACKLLAMTWVRTRELRTMQWAHIEGDTWRIPAEIMKMGEDHLVPLSRQALQALAKLRMRCRGSAYVFPSDRTNDRPMSENAVLYLIHRIGFKGRHSGHGWRSTASTWANESGRYESDWIEAQLAHNPESSNEVRAAYNRARYMPQRRKMLQDFADWLDAASGDRAS